jgi:hypothetical protein
MISELETSIYEGFSMAMLNNQMVVIIELDIVTLWGLICKHNGTTNNSGNSKGTEKPTSIGVW